MNQLDQITQTIRNAVKEATNKTMSLQSAKALAAKVIGERNMHAASQRASTTAESQDGYTWHVVGHYDDIGQPFHGHVRAKDGFSALLEMTLRLQEENPDELPQLVLHCAINAFNGYVQFPSDEVDATVFVEDLVQHLDGYTPFSVTHPIHPQETEMTQNAENGYKVQPKSGAFISVDGKAEVGAIDKIAKLFAEQGVSAGDFFPEPQGHEALQKELHRVDLMSAWDRDPTYSLETWQKEAYQGETTQSYKEWVASQYIKASGLDLGAATVAVAKSVFQKAAKPSKKEVALEKEFARVDAMQHWESDPVYSAEDWNYEVTNGDTRLSYKEWVKNQYEMNQNN